MFLIAYKVIELIRNNKKWSLSYLNLRVEVDSWLSEINAECIHASQH